MQKYSYLQILCSDSGLGQAKMLFIAHLHRHIGYLCLKSPVPLLYIDLLTWYQLDTTGTQTRNIGVTREGLCMLYIFSRMKDSKQCVRICSISPSDLTTTGVTELNQRIWCDVQRMRDSTLHVDSSQMVVGSLQMQDCSNQQP